MSRIFAAHEAGHAVVAWHYGREVRSVSVMPACVDVGVGPNWRRDLEVIAGGEAGEMMAGCREGWGKVLDYACHRATLDGERTERGMSERAYYLKAQGLGDEYALTPEWLTSLVLAQAVLEERRAQWELVTNELLFVPTLHQGQFAALMEQARRSTLRCST